MEIETENNMNSVFRSLPKEAIEKLFCFLTAGKMTNIERNISQLTEDVLKFLQMTHLSHFQFSGSQNHCVFGYSYIHLHYKQDTPPYTVYFDSVICPVPDLVLYNMETVNEYGIVFGIIANIKRIHAMQMKYENENNAMYEMFSSVLAKHETYYSLLSNSLLYKLFSDLAKKLDDTVTEDMLFDYSTELNNDNFIAQLNGRIHGLIMQYLNYP